MSQTENQINTVDNDYEKKKQKLHPAPENEEENSNLKKMKKSTPKSPIVDKENNQTLEEGEVTEVGHEDADKGLRLKSASRSRSNYKNKSKSHMKSKSKSRSKARAVGEKVEEKIEKLEETEKTETTKGADLSASAYSLRPRKNVDYSKISPEGNNKSAENPEPKSEDKSDASFRVEDCKDPEPEEIQDKDDVVDGDQSNSNQADEKMVAEETLPMKDPKNEEEPHPQEADKVSESSEDENPEALKEELQELKGIYCT
jgi:hypothetical protein